MRTPNVCAFVCGLFYGEPTPDSLIASIKLMGGSGAMLAYVVREAISTIAAPEVAERIERAALLRAGYASLPTDALTLARFVDDALYDTIADYLGDDVADAVKLDLEPIIANAEASSGVLEMDGPRDGASLMSVRKESTAPPPDSTQRKIEGSRRVLIADDDADVLDAMARTLRAEGVHVVTATDGYAALELCQSMRPDVVIADLHMPAISGRQLVHTLRRTMGRDAPPVIIVTGNVFAPNNVEGAVEVLRKPLDVAELVAAIELAAWDHVAGI